MVKRLTHIARQRGHVTTERDFKKLGMSKDVLTRTNIRTIDELNKHIPNMVIVESKYNNTFGLGNSDRAQMYKKGNSYVMPLYMYNSMVTQAKTEKPAFKPAKVKFSNVYRKYNGHNLDNKTLLIWRTGGIGDLLFIKPNIDFLKKRYPTCKIIFGTSPEYQCMIKDWECIDQIIDIPFPVTMLYKCDYHITFEGVIERTEQAKTDNAYILFSKWMGLNLYPTALSPVQTPNVELTRYVREIFENDFNIIEGTKTCLMQLRASSPIRTPHYKFWKQIMGILVNELGYRIIITDLPKYQMPMEHVIKKEFSNCNPNMFHVFCKYSKNISYTIALASFCDLCVGTDSSLIHIAESVGTKNFGFFGPFPGEIRSSTYKHGDFINCDNIICAPCFKHGHAPCPNSFQQTANCYNSMDFSLFSEKIKALIER